MAVILPANDAIYQIAQCFLLLSYVQVNILFLRVVLCFGSLFFAVWCGVSLPGISVDGVVYNVIFGFINFVQAVFLAREMLPIKFTAEQQKMYTTLFGSFLTPYQFKLLLNHGRRRKIRKLNSVLSQEGNPFSMIALVVEKDPTAVFIVEKDGVKLNELSLFNWIGMPEYTEYLEAKKLAEGKSVDGDILNRVTHKLMTDNAPVAFWVWEVEDLEKLFCHKSHGAALYTGLNSVILMGLSALLIHLNGFHVSLYKRLNDNQDLIARSSMKLDVGSVTSSMIRYEATGSAGPDAVPDTVVITGGTHLLHSVPVSTGNQL